MRWAALLGLLILVSTAARAQDLPLFKYYPSLRDTVGRIEILKSETPLEPLPRLEAELYNEAGRPVPSEGALWVKRDDGSDSALGGNKARKLEFLLADAEARHKHTLITSGMYGSNHALATAVAASQLGFKARLILGPQPVTENVKQKLLAYHALGAELRFHSNRITMGLDMLGQALEAGLFPGRKLFYIPPGGSNDVGDLGYVNAFLELLEQTGAEGLPARIYVPVGTMGTSMGLLVGSCLGGVYGRTQIVGVNVADPLLTNSHAARSQALSLYKFIRKHLALADRARLPKCDFWSRKAFRFVTEYYAPGYGATRPEVFESMKLVRATESITLDGTYSGKAMQALLDTFRSELRAGQTPPKTLFWLTYDSYDLERIIATYPWKHPDAKWLDLPRDFWPLFTQGRPGT